MRTLCRVSAAWATTASWFGAPSTPGERHRRQREVGGARAAFAPVQRPVVHDREGERVAGVVEAVERAAIGAAQPDGRGHDDVEEARGAALAGQRAADFDQVLEPVDESRGGGRCHRGRSGIGSRQFTRWHARRSARRARVRYNRDSRAWPVGAATFPARMDAAAAIVVADLRKSYGDVEAVKGISFSVRRGTTTALLGGNGAGQDDDAVDAARRADADGRARHRARRGNAAGSAISVLPRLNFTSPYVDLPKRLTVRENLAVFADLYGVRDVRERIDRRRRRLRSRRDLLKRPYGTLSAGQRTRVSLAKAVINEPEVLLLDEPTASLDPDIGDRMRTYLEQYQRRTGCTMLLASHHMGEVERMCDDVIMLRDGSRRRPGLAAGAARALRARQPRGCVSSTSRAAAPDEPVAGSAAEEIASM